MSILSDYNLNILNKDKPYYEGMDSLFHKTKGFIYTNLINRKKLYQISLNIYKISTNYIVLEQCELNNKLEMYKKLFELNQGSKFIEEALAYICEAARRSLGYRPYAVQIMGVLAQYKGFAIQMKPGEGKTITAALTAILFAWQNKPCHIITSNDYLAKRDSQNMQSLYTLCNLFAGFIISEHTKDERIKMYQAHILYTTSKEIVADYLKDGLNNDYVNKNQKLLHLINKKSTNEKQLLRGLYSAIIDEADSVLADDAITPLIIASQQEDQLLKQNSNLSYKIIEKLKIDIDYQVNKNYKEIFLTKNGKEYINNYLKNEKVIWKSVKYREFMIEQALVSKYFFILNKDYVINEGKIILIDKTTGRLTNNRTLNNGLHQAIEIKEHLEMTNPTTISAKISFQRFFRLYPRITGMSGTFSNLNKELWDIYDLPIVKIPKRINKEAEINKPIILKTKIEKYKTVVNYIIKTNKIKRPILVGTKDIIESEYIYKLLLNKNIKASILNALTKEDEAAIILRAGEESQITIATNMAGRGTDILISNEVNELGGLLVISLEKFNSSRIDKQLFGRAARQGQNGSVQEIYSLEDSLLKQLPKSLKLILTKYIDNKLSYTTILYLYMFLQYKEDFISSIKRKNNLKQDMKHQENLSFSNI